MKLLFDQNLSYRLCRALTDIFPGSEQVTRVALHNASDDAIWTHAGRNGFVIVTLDADFADMATLRGTPPKVIWLRCGNRPTAFVEYLLRKHTDAIARFVESDGTACLELY